MLISGEPSGVKELEWDVEVSKLSGRERFKY